MADINIAKGAGFCKGVKRAFDMAESLAKKYGKIYTIGELVHNELVTEYLNSIGAHAITDQEAQNLGSGDVCLIRAHGIPYELEVQLRDRGVIVFDATCPIVKKNQLLLRSQSDLGNEIYLFGDSKHDEITGLKSYGKNVHIVSDVDEINFDSDCAVLFQTTILKDKFDEIKKKIEKITKTSTKSVGIFNTICYTTKARQDEARILAKNSDAFFVLGSLSSANTRRLFEVGSQVNKNTFFIHSVDDMNSINLKDFQCISVTAGASSPPWLIQEVTNIMSETQKTAAELAQEVEVKEEATLQNEANQAEVEKEITMEDIVKSDKAMGFVSYKPGKRVVCTVISADDNGLIVAFGGKNDGFIEKSEIAIDGNYSKDDYKAGDKIEAKIIAVEKGSVSLSKKEVDILLIEEAEAEKALAAGEFELVMTEVVKGGLRGRLGKYVIFVPASQIKIGYVKDLEIYKGKKLRLTLMPAKEEKEGEDKQKKSRYLFASQRILLEKEKQEKEDAFWNNIHIHDIVVGKVKRFTPFGAFVSVRGFDCLAHISELSWNKISDPSTVLTIGESYDFVVMKLDRETGKISLGYKQLQKKPYEIAAETYPVGTVIKGKVERIFSYGAFISISEGVDGLAHVSQISHNWIKDANEALKVGEEVEAKIIGFEDNRITLSIKELLPEPELKEEDAEIVEGEDKAKAKSASRLKKFEQKVADGEVKRERRPRKDTSNEPKEWVSGTSTSSLGDLFKNLDLNLSEEE